MEYSCDLESPERMRLWAGISTISAALQRRVWTEVKFQHCYANMYVLLCGPPGVGKGNAMKLLGNWLREIDALWISPDGLTRRSFFSTMEAAVCEDLSFAESGSALDSLSKRHHSLTAFIEELGVFLHAGDNDFIYTLCHIYDTPTRFHYKTESAGENYFENAWFSMLSAVTPKGLKDIFTDQALEMGISARTVIIYSDEKIDVDIFGKIDRKQALEKDLKFDLNRITKIQGQYQFEQDAATELVAWAATGFKPEPKDPRFTHYNSRRFVQIIKLCMICAASKRQDPIILKEDLFQAKTFLLEAERVMSGAVASIGSNPYLDTQQRAIRLINTKYETQKKGTIESELRQQLSQDLDPRYSDMILDDIAKARWVSTTGDKPNRTFWPRGRTSEDPSSAGVQ